MTTICYIRSNHDSSVQVVDGVSEVIADVLKNGATLAIVSTLFSNKNKAKCVKSFLLRRYSLSGMYTQLRYSRIWLVCRYEKVLSQFVPKHPDDGEEKSILQLAEYIEFTDGMQNIYDNSGFNLINNRHFRADGRTL